MRGALGYGALGFFGHLPMLYALCSLKLCHVFLHLQFDSNWLGIRVCYKTTPSPIECMGSRGVVSFTCRNKGLLHSETVVSLAKHMLSLTLCHCSSFTVPLLSLDQ